MAGKRDSNIDERLVSLDAYRGFVMLAMASSALHLSNVFRDPAVLDYFQGAAYASWWTWFCHAMAFQAEHSRWGGCAFWDLIQPSFMFMVGVAIPYSYASRVKRGDGYSLQFLHTILRSMILILLGVFLSSNGKNFTNYTFVNVLTQIGMGYTFVWLLQGTGKWVQLAAVVLISGLTWYAFYQHPLPESGYPVDYGLPADWPVLTGVSAHWNKNVNFAVSADQWFINLFPHPVENGITQIFHFNGGGYQTLNFVPSMITMIFGLMTGEMLRAGGLSPLSKTKRMLWTGAVCHVIGLACDGRMWWFYPIDWSVCPIIKQLWTPSWAFYSTSFTLWFLAAFYWVLDVRGWRWLAFPLKVVGMNSIAIYCAAQLLKPWIRQTLLTHLSQVPGNVTDWLTKNPGHQTINDLAVLFVLWLMCLWLYRQRIFVRI